MSMDELGNVYISNGQGVMAFDPNGNNILRIPTGGAATCSPFPVRRRVARHAVGSYYGLGGGAPNRCCTPTRRIA